MYSSREVFSNPPLQLVAAELRYTYAPKLRRDATIEALARLLHDTFPILDSQQQTVVKLTAGGALAEEETETIPRLYDDRRTASIAIAPMSATVETTHYSEFSTYKQQVIDVAAAIGELGAVAALTRVGLRFINEVRVPDLIKDVRDWEGWIAPDLLAAVRLAGDRYPAATYQGLVRYLIDEDKSLVFRFAALDGPGVVGNGPLRRRRRVQPGPYFVLDMDCSIQSDTDDPWDYDVHRIAAVLDELHSPHGEVFQSSITDRLREVFRGNHD